jgi:phage shock protein C
MSNLHKSKNSKVLFGVCGGLAETWGLDPSIVRIGFLLGAIFTGSILLWIYLALALVLPSEN